MRYWLIMLCMFSVVTVFGQKSAKVRELENQRKAALKEIELTNTLLSQTQISTQNSLNRLNLLSRQIEQRKRVISLLNQEVTMIDKDISIIRGEINVLEKELNSKRDNYSTSLRRMQKHHNSQDKLLFIFSADNFSQSVRRMRYLREYAAWQETQATDIIKKQKTIKSKFDELEKSRVEKSGLLKSREREYIKLEEEEAIQKQEVADLNRKQRQLQDDLQKKQRQANALNRQIENQITQEVARAAAEAKAARELEERDNPTAKATPSKRVAESKGGYAMTREEKQLSDNFANNRGRLPAPVTGRYTIVGAFGEQQHQALKHVRINNNGIDLLTTANSEARAVFDGTVTAIIIEPGFGNTVIIRHGNYLTVYSNLSSVYVKKNDKVKTRQSIGRLYTDTDNGNTTILHFELWKETNKQNPQPWLSY